MITLFIDTHGNNIDLALSNNGKISSIRKDSSKGHSEIAIPTIIDFLNSNRLDIHDVNEIIVVNGPGSFTGVRIGVTIAKALAYTLKVPIKTITSLEVCGLSARDYFDVSTVRDSKGVYTSLYDNGKYCNLEYRKNNDFDKYISDNNYSFVEEDIIDFDKVFEYASHIDCINPHEANPIYIKEIDALK